MGRILVLSFWVMFAAMGFAQDANANWKVVPNETVCMVTEAHFTRPQIPVKVDGKTYYGCCANCKKTLTEDKKSRTAQDAFTGESVDKAKAVIAANDLGEVRYFLNKKNFENYLRKTSDTKSPDKSKSGK